MITDGEENISYMYMVSEDMLMIIDYTPEQRNLTPDEEGYMNYVQAYEGYC